MRKKYVVVGSAVAVSLIVTIAAIWYFYSITADYEIKLLWAEEYTLRIGFQEYKFRLRNTGSYSPPRDEYGKRLTVTSGNNTETRDIGYPSSAVGKTFKFLDLEVYIKEVLVDGLRLVVRKW